jgi:hypothetical protein
MVVDLSKLVRVQIMQTFPATSTTVSVRVLCTSTKYSSTSFLLLPLRIETFSCTVREVLVL